ncbi:MAG: DUF255 domain-containing protein [Akkermansiaceae bacterium]|nr:DUF255 domain-containing protein [Akkermansiaceae bacterium]
MNYPNPKRLIFAGLTITGVFFLGGCGEKEADAELSPEISGDMWRSGADENALKGLPGMIYAAAESSPIHWQPWQKESQEMAERYRRLMLVVIAIPQQPSYARILADLAADPKTVDEINRNYVPILVDGDSVRELEMLTAYLCSEIGSAAQLPLMVWMTPDFNPVAWIPLPVSGSESVVSLFGQSHEMVKDIWVEDSAYVSLNSRMDQENRAVRVKAILDEQELSEEPGADSLRALRQLTSLYDPVSRTFDEAGGLFPCGVIDLLSMGARMDDISGRLREKCKDTLENLLDDLLVSAMFDPLDGGVYNSRRRFTWAFPGFHRDCATQGRVAVSLLDGYGVTGDKRALERALGILTFVEKTYRTQGGLFSLGGGRAGDTEGWLWHYEDVKGWLSEEELSAWVLASGMKASGNLPSEADPLREFFRANSISFAKTAEQVSALSGVDLKSTEAALGSAREKLLKVRDSRLNPPAEKRAGNAAATFRMVSAYATAYRITGDEDFRERAASTLSKARESFSDGRRLRSYDRDAAPSLVAGRAFTYGLAIQAALDVAAVTLDESWILWASDLSSTVSEIFVQDDSLRECPAAADLTGLPIVDHVMLFDQSSTGILAMADSRLKALSISLVPSFWARVNRLPLAALDRPVMYTDILQATLMREYGFTYVFGDDVPSEMREAIARSPLKGVSRRGYSELLVKGQELDPKVALRIGPGKKIQRIESAGDIAVPSLP